jgi:GMP reductase
MQALHYKDVVLIPSYSNLSSRANADVTVKLFDHVFKAPVLPSNMKCTIDVETARLLSNAGYFYIMHRFDVCLLDFIRIANEENWPCISISIGVNASDRVVFDELYNSNLRIDFITVDIAHGHHQKMKETLSYLQKFRNRGTRIIAGNIVTAIAAKDLAAWGADIVKAGIGQGFVCTTKDKTGFTVPMFTCIENMSRVNVPIIADGGVRCNGDIVKAIVGGASMVMCGGMFAKLLDSPSASFKDQHTGETLKEYYGSASFHNKGVMKNIEGRRELMAAEHMTYLQKMDEIIEDLQSAVSYAGGNELLDLRRVQHYTQNV